MPTTGLAKSPTAVPGAAHPARAGLAYGITAYLLWGVFPLYFRAVSHVSPLIILCHRILWSALSLAFVISYRRDWRAVFSVFADRRRASLLCLGAVLIALNWLLFIYSVASRQVLQASLGYFVNPLLSIALGVIFLHEHLRRTQWVAVAIAGSAVAVMALQGSGLPWLAASLALTWGFYGLVRKMADLDSLHALLWESLLLVLPAALMLFLVPHDRTDSRTLGLLSLSGIITVVPLLMFGVALRRLRLTTIGFLQYIGPTLQFLVAIVVFREPLDHAKIWSFVLCWVAIAVYVFDSVINRQPQILADEPE